MKKFFNQRLFSIFASILLVCLITKIAYSFTNGNISLSKQEKNALKNTVYIITSDNCMIKFAFLEQKAPKHVKRIKELIKERYFDGIAFHRVIPGFMVQAGGKNGNLNAGSGKKIKAEFSDIKHVRGIVSMARASDPDSADAQFFIVTKDSLFLDGQYSAFGIVIDGMDCVDEIKKGNEVNNGIVENPTIITKMRITYDIEMKNAIKK